MCPPLKVVYILYNKDKDLSTVFVKFPLPFGNFDITEKIKEALNKERVYTSIIVPGNQKIHICTGCMDCDKDGKCDFIDDMRKNIADACGICISQVSVKATTEEHLGFTGAGEGISAHAVCLIYKS